MSQAKHTAGPWIVDGDGVIMRDARTTAERTRVGLVHTTVGNKSVAEIAANARLIAAAPEMFALLHQIWAKTDPSTDTRTCQLLSELLGRIEGGGQ